MLKNEQTPIQAQWAAYFFGQKLEILPIYGILPDGGCTCGKPDCQKEAGKHPMYKDWQKGSFFQSAESIRQFWQSHPNANYGILTSGLLVLDIDERHCGVESFEKFIKPHIVGVKTLTARSGSGGESKHLYFRDAMQEFKNSSDIYPGVDIRSTAGGYIIGIGSKHKSGNCYELIDLGTTGDTIGIAELPEGLRKLLISSKTKKKSLNKAANIFSGEIHEGSRNDSLASYAGALRRKGLSEEQMSCLLLEKNKTCVPPLEDEEVLRISKSIARYPEGNQQDWNEPRLDYEIKDAGFQDIFFDLIPDVFREFVLKKQKALGVPLAAIMVSILCHIAAILGAAFKVSPSKKSDFKVTLNLWGAFIAPSGTKKTALVSLFQNVVEEIDKYFINKRIEASDADKKSLSELSVKLKSLPKDEIEKKSELEFKILGLKSKEQPAWCFSVDNATPEALAQLCKYNFRGVMFLCDELGGLLAILNKNGYEDLRALLNKGWNGAMPHRLTRITRGIIDIPSTTISVLGGIQPDSIESSFKEELRRGAGGDGLLARYQLIVFYKNTDIKEIDTSVDIAQEAMSVNGVLRAIHQCTREFNLNGLIPNEILVLSDEAALLYSSYEKRINQRLSSEEITNQAYISHISKFGRLVLSLAGQFHIIEAVVKNLPIEKTVEERWVKLAIKWADFFDIQAKSLYFSISKGSSARALVLKIKNGDITDGMSVRAIYRKGWSGLQYPDDVLSAIETISDSNWVMLITDSPRGGGRKTDIVRLNPKLLEWLKTNSKSIHIDPTDKTDERGNV